MSLKDRIRELEQFHDQLRGALIAAGRQIRKFRHNPENAKNAAPSPKRAPRGKTRPAWLQTKPEETRVLHIQPSTRVHFPPQTVNERMQYQPSFDLDSMS